MKHIPTEIIDEFFKHMDPHRRLERRALKRCRLVCRRFYQIAHPHAFRILRLAGSERNKELPFEAHLTQVGDVKNSHIVKCVKELVITGPGCWEEPEDWSSANWRSILDWPTLCTLVRPFSKLTELDLQSVLWIPTPSSVQSEEDQIVCLTTWAPNPLHVKLYDFSLRFHADHGAFPLSAVLASPQVNRLTIERSYFTTRSLDAPPPWSCPKICVNCIESGLVNLLGGITGVTHLELRGLQDSEHVGDISDVLQRNQATLRILELGIALSIADRGEDWLACSLAHCTKLQTLVVEMPTVAYRTIRPQEIEQANESEDEQEQEREEQQVESESEQNDGQEDEQEDEPDDELENALDEKLGDDMEHSALQWTTTDYTRLVASLLSSLPPSTECVRLIFENNFDAQYLQRDIQRFDWKQVGRLLSTHSGLEILALEFAGVLQQPTWQALGLAQLVTEKLVQGNIRGEPDLGYQVRFSSRTCHSPERELAFVNWF